MGWFLFLCKKSEWRVSAVVFQSILVQELWDVIFCCMLYAIVLLCSLLWSMY